MNTKNNDFKSALPLRKNFMLKNFQKVAFNFEVEMKINWLFNNALCVRLGVSICLDVVSIETLDLDTEKNSVSTAEKISTVSKS